jgi:hypothetical protein
LQNCIPSEKHFRDQDRPAGELPTASSQRYIGETNNRLEMNWHEVIDERSYELHRVIGDVLRQDPSNLDLVVNWIRRRLDDPQHSIHSKHAITEWLDIIRSRGLKGVLDVIADRSEDATRMRQSSSICDNHASRQACGNFPQI